MKTKQINNGENMAYQKTSVVLKEARTKSKLSQGDLAKKFKFKSAQFISNWERGLSAPPLNKAKKLCDILKVPKETFKTAYLADCKVREEKHLEKSWK
jgi:transcriptional regulator with XRE-family HTH domain